MMMMMMIIHYHLNLFGVCCHIGLTKIIIVIFKVIISRHEWRRGKAVVGKRCRWGNHCLNHNLSHFLSMEKFCNQHACVQADTIMTIKVIVNTNVKGAGWKIIITMMASGEEAAELGDADSGLMWKPHNIEVTANIIINIKNNSEVIINIIINIKKLWGDRQHHHQHNKLWGDLQPEMQNAQIIFSRF